MTVATLRVFTGVRARCVLYAVFLTTWRLFMGVCARRSLFALSLAT